MSVPTNRTQRILRYIARSKKPVTHAKCVAIGEPDRPYHEVSPAIAAQLCSLAQAGKLKRFGKPRHHTYGPTPTTLIDERKAKNPNGPRRSTAEARPKAKAKPAPRPPKPTAAPKPKLAAKPASASRQAFANLRPPVTRAPGQRETVAEFEARGGVVQKLGHGESSQSAYIDVREQDLRAMRTRLQKLADPTRQPDAEGVAA
jgi:hypothetical protein